MDSFLSKPFLLGKSRGASGAFALQRRLGSPQGLFLDFTDDSSLIIDGAVPANNYRGKAFDKLTFTRASTRKRFDPSGSLADLATDVPAIDYDPIARAINGLQIEGARTNLCLWSRALTTGANGWQVTTSSAVDAVGIDGVANSATTVTIGTTLDVVWKGSITVTASTVYTFSFYAKAGTATGLNCAVYNESGAAFIVSTQAYTPGNGVFERITVTFTTPVGCTSVRIYPLRTASGTGTVIIDGVQLEAGAIPSSYIPTTNATVTRAAEVCKIATTLFPATATGPYTIFAKAITPPNAGADTGRVIASLCNGGYPESRFLYKNPTGLFQGISTTGAVNTASVGGTTVSSYSLMKEAVRYDLNNVNAATNGTLGTVDTTCAYPLAPTQLNIGNLHDTGLNYWHGWIQQIAVIPVALTDAQLQAVTA